MQDRKARLKEKEKRKTLLTDERSHKQIVCVSVSEWMHESVCVCVCVRVRTNACVYDIN